MRSTEWMKFEGRRIRPRSSHECRQGDADVVKSAVRTDGSASLSFVFTCNEALEENIYDWDFATNVLANGPSGEGEEGGNESLQRTKPY